MATERPDWVPDGWEWSGRDSTIRRHTADDWTVLLDAYAQPRFTAIKFSNNGNTHGYLVVDSLETALAIAELLADERGGWA